MTRIGFHFVLLGGFAMLGGSLRGFNLLLVLAGLIVGALFVQWRFCIRSVAALRVQRRLPTQAFAGIPFRIKYRLQNQSRYWSARMLRIEDRIESADRLHSSTLVCGVGAVGPAATVESHCDCLITHRGSYRLDMLNCTTTYPLSLLQARSARKDPGELLVLPRLLTLHRGWQNHLRGRSGIGLTATSRRRGPNDGEFFGLREWQTGDNSKWIHWRSSARLAEPVVRQFEQQRQFDLCLVVDMIAAPAEGESGTELAISLAATLVKELTGSPRNRVVLAIAGKEAEVIANCRFSEARMQMFRALARAQTTEHPQIDLAIDRILARTRGIRDLVIISSRPCPTATGEALRKRSSRLSLQWLDVNDSANRWWVADKVLPNNAQTPEANPRRVDEVSA